MKKALWTALILAALSTGTAHAIEWGHFWWDMNVADLPAACTVGQTFVIKNGNTVDDCVTGTGAFIVACRCDAGGSTYSAGVRTAGQGLADDGAAPSMDLALSYADTLAGNPAFAAEECVFSLDGIGGGSFLCEGTTPKTTEQLYIFPAVDGVDTTDFIVVNTNQVTGVEGDGLVVTTGVLDVKLLDAADSTGGTSTRSGLEFGDTGSDELTLLQGCSANNVMQWNEGTGFWECGAGGSTNSFETWNTDLGTNPVADSATDTIAVTSAIAMTITGVSTPDSATFDFDYTNEMAALDIAMAVDECLFRADTTGGGFVCEGSTADANEQEYLFPDVNGADTTDRIVVDATEVTSVDGAGMTITTGTLNVVAGVGIAVAADAVAFDFSDAGADPAFAADEARFSNEGASPGGIVFEGTTANTFETRIRVIDPTVADRIVNIPDADSSTGVAITCTGDDKVSAFNAATGVFTCSTDQLGGNSFGTIGSAVADSAGDTITVTDGLGVDLITTDNPEDLSADFLYTGTLAGNVALGVEDCVFSNDGAGGGSFLCEGTAANTNEQLYLFPAVDGVDTTDFIAVNTNQVTDLEGAGLSVTAGTLNADHTGVFSINQTTHGLAVGNSIHFNGTTWEGSDADADKPSHGIVITVPDVNNFDAAVSGLQTITTHGFTLGQNFISTTAAAISTADAGPGNIIQQVLVAIDVNTVILSIGTPVS